MSEKIICLLTFFFVFFPSSFAKDMKNDLHLFYYPKAEKSLISDDNNYCENGGILKQLGGKKECFCDGTRHYGANCQFECNIERHEFIIPEECLTNPYHCRVPSSCIDTRINLFVNRGRVDYPICNPAPEICMDKYNTFYVNRTTSANRIYKCENGGVLKRLNHTSRCMCKGTAHFGSRCQNDCRNLGYIIPEKCLQGKDCGIPTSCVDVSREPKIRIDRCQNGGVFLIGKSGDSCNCFSTGFWGRYCTRPCLSQVPSWCKQNNCSNFFPADCLF